MKMKKFYGQLDFYLFIFTSLSAGHGNDFENHRQTPKQQLKIEPKA